MCLSGSLQGLRLLTCCALTTAESKFHYVVQRGPLRAESEAWKRVEPGSYKIPTEMEAWVGASSSSGGSTTVVAETVETSAASP